MVEVKGYSRCLRDKLNKLGKLESLGSAILVLSPIFSFDVKICYL